MILKKTMADLTGRKNWIYEFIPSEVPEVSLGYSSGHVDVRTAAEGMGIRIIMNATAHFASLRPELSIKYIK